jgi:MFS transporter, OFA family, oxalate/formate antiporter
MARMRILGSLLDALPTRRPRCRRQKPGAALLKPNPFGSRHATTNYGFLYIAQGVGSILGGPVAAAMRVATGSWTPVFGVAVGMDIVTALLALFVLKPMRAAYLGAQTRAPAGELAPAASR